MLTGELRNRIDTVWNAFWSGGIANPLEVIEQITYLLFTLTAEEASKNNLPDVVARWAERAGTERGRARTEQSFCVSKMEIAAADYDLSLNRYKEVVHEAAEHRAPKEIIADLKALEQEIFEELDELEAML
ncbi:hypothetical protein ASG52_25200 [Methylobacterium sp. Leaf456]|uniref:type I restriction-modification system subunit M N-terminal domain-containing protein n=1 Tax=Methylobacterium sp. Leaf456 TaxID=1736382 RepID=UPI0006FA45AF|nr:type I restriction-modification system subunit M N-terminal domain-containing protein [Methylobacterium sp. Leaf456]KQT55025.1 hypothetical protein ASG52_25200 [Methylobacterium sp. Leaf456]